MTEACEHEGLDPESVFIDTDISCRMSVFCIEHGNTWVSLPTGQPYRERVSHFPYWYLNDVPCEGCGDTADYTGLSIRPDELVWRTKQDTDKTNVYLSHFCETCGEGYEVTYMRDFEEEEKPLNKAWTVWTLAVAVSFGVLELIGWHREPNGTYSRYLRRTLGLDPLSGSRHIRSAVFVGFFGWFVSHVVFGVGPYRRKSADEEEV